MSGIHRSLVWIVRPKPVLAKILEDPSGAWRLPLIIITVLALLQVLTGAPLRKAELLQEPPPMPQDFMYYPPETQEQYLRALEVTSGPAFTLGFPALIALAEVWMGWLSVGGLLFLLLTLMGMRIKAPAILGLTAWSGMPQGVRSLIQTLYMVVSGVQVAEPGLSGFFSANGSSILAQVSRYIDIYVFWQFGLILLGLSMMIPNQRLKLLLSVLIVFLLALLMWALPGYLGGRMGSMTIIRPYF